jgi:hypothetical protein
MRCRDKAYDFETRFELAYSLLVDELPEEISLSIECQDRPHHLEAALVIDYPLLANTCLNINIYIPQTFVSSTFPN